MRAYLTGAWAALRAPLWLRGARLARLLEASTGRRRPAPRRAESAVRVSRFALRLLARPPGSPWRNTCLYRSAAECLVWRRFGVPARLRMGVRPGSAERPIDAHAWVERSGGAREAGGYAELRRTRPAGSARETRRPEASSG